MGYTSLYRKWRPQTFDEIAGQAHVTQTIKNAIKLGRISHAYLFCGPRGTGKTTTARIFAKAINCEKGPTTTPCNKCESCLSITNGNSIDVLELDAASNRKVDEIRELLEKIPYGSTQGNKKVYIIDEVHMLTTESFNTLLKTLEEPPDHVIFILATTEPHKVLPTILSRCQRFDFRRISVNDIKERLEKVSKEEGIEVEEDALLIIAHHAQGALRDALGILEQLANYSDKEITADDVVALLGITNVELLHKFTDILIDKNLSDGLLFLEQLVEKGHDIKQFILDLMNYLRSLYLEKSVGKIQDPSIPTNLLTQFQEQAGNIDSKSLLFFITTLSDVYNQSRWTTDIRLQLEIALFKMIKSTDDISLEGILHRLEKLESLASSTEHVFLDHKIKSTEHRVSSSNKESKPTKEKTSKIAEKSEIKNQQEVDEINTSEENYKSDYLEISFESIQKIWPQVLKIIKEKKRTRYPFFSAAKLDRFENGKLVLRLKETDKQFVESPENLSLLRQSIKIASGYDIQVVCESEKEKKQASKIVSRKTVAVVDSEDDVEDVLSIGEYIKIVQDTFGAKIVEDIDIDLSGEDIIDNGMSSED